MRWHISLAFLLLIAASQVALQSAEGAINSFTTTGSDYSTATDWTLGTIPGDGNNDEPWIGNTNTAAATYNSATSYTTTGRFIVGIGGTGNGTLTMSGSAGTLTFGGNDYASANYVGVDGGTGVLNVNGGSLVTTTGAAIRVGANSGTSNGTLNLGGGSVTVNGLLYAGVEGGGGTATGTINLTSSSSTLTAAQLWLRRGTYTQSAGTANFRGNSYGSANVIADTTTFTFNANGGTTNFIDASGVSGHLHIGMLSTTSDGIMNVGGGTVNVGSRILMANNAAGGKATLTVSSGIISIGTGSNSESDKGWVYLAAGNNNATGKAIVNLDGGTLSLVRLEPGFGTNGASQKEVNFNGGVLQARANSTTFLNAATGFAANVKNGGAIFDTEGYNVTVAAALVNSGSGGLTKQDTGTLTLSNNANTYIGNTTISGGTLALATTSTNNVANSAQIDIASGATLDVSGVTGSGGFALASGQILSGAGTVTGDLTVSSGAFIKPGSSPGILTVNGDLSIAGTYTADLTGSIAGTGYDQLLLSTGTQNVSLSGTLSDTFTGSGWSSLGDTLWIVKNDTAGTLTGVFSNYGTNGQTIGSYDGKLWQIWYGADFANNALSGGNDVALFAVPVPEPSTFAMLLFGSLMMWVVGRKRSR